MSVRDTLADMAALATRLEAEGADIISAGMSMITGPHLHLSSYALPPSIKERGALRGRRGGDTEYGYVEDDIAIFWLEAGA